MNSGATNSATRKGYVQLINGFRKVLVDALGNVTCNGTVAHSAVTLSQKPAHLRVTTDLRAHTMAGDKALSKAFLIGTGSPGATYLRWAVNYNSDDVQLEYFYQTSLLGVTSMMAGTPLPRALHNASTSRFYLCLATFPQAMLTSEPPYPTLR